MTTTIINPADTTTSFVVVTGNPIDGHTLHGPFTDANDAGDWAADHLDDHWWTAPVHTPNP